MTAAEARPSGRVRPLRTLARLPWTVLKGMFGWIVLFELRNKVLLAPSGLRLRRLVNAEIARIRTTLPDLPEPLVVTAIPTYRRPEELLVAVRSALAQTVRDQLVVVVDDGSGSLPAAGLPDDPRLVAVAMERNSGDCGVVRNVAMRLTRSRYVAFLDDDNVWAPDHLETALAVLEAPDGPDAVYTAVRRVLPDGSEHDVLSVPWDRRRNAREAFVDINAFVARRVPGMRFSWLYRPKGVMPREDWEFVRRYARGRRVLHIPHVTVQYLVNPTSFFTQW
ncbi:glycosyltransferase family 2 protein [Actinacidiphila rubida]|uniref:Glycosyl transferase family 2 n=1 Tax=Actinacidiphila rubida TaxID=310780 RepID=A0A1H8LPR0_9ACTN|nr:glycosyltransferase [Actinacidiphila rubida]SEO07107.1 Glycosyl transferase family 2 [Actinacidiphila rubida]